MKTWLPTMLPLRSQSHDDPAGTPDLVIHAIADLMATTGWHLSIARLDAKLPHLFLA
jgi:hypothetical protein